VKIGTAKKAITAYEEALKVYCDSGGMHLAFPPVYQDQVFHFLDIPQIFQCFQTVFIVVFKFWNIMGMVN